MCTFHGLRQAINFLLRFLAFTVQGYKLTKPRLDSCQQNKNSASFSRIEKGDLTVERERKRGREKASQNHSEYRWSL